MRSLIFILILIFFSSGSGDQSREINFQHSATYRWLNKKVLESRVLDDMEDTGHWKTFTTGAQQIVDARVDLKFQDITKDIVTLSVSAEQYVSRGHSLKMKIPTKLELPGPKSGRGWGTAGVRRIFDGEDWRSFNRISIQLFPDCPGTYVNWIELRIFNDGTEKLPALFAQEGETSLILRNHEWNQVVWEIDNVARDKVTALEISYYLSGNEPEAADTATYYLDQLELQKVEPEYIEGWAVWPGRISYSQEGYEPGAVKTAIVSGLPANRFSLIDQATGETVLSKPVKVDTTHLGIFQVMDFSELRRPGNYILEAGDNKTEPFPVGNNTWRESILKALNFFHEERCGYPIPGRHGVCHRDWICREGDKSMVVNGGWHDAGDLTQGITNTGEAAYAMFSLADKLKSLDQDKELCNRLMEEAQWGLDWIMKTSFRDGYRYSGSANSRKTDGIVGTNDDISVEARNNPADHFIASAAEGIAARALKDIDPRLAAFSVVMAEEDWNFAVDKMDLENIPDPSQHFRGTFDSNNVTHELASEGIIASLELWKVTGNKNYIDKAIQWARVIIDSQQRALTDWNIPMAGFFYTGPDKKYLLHYVHRGHEQEPIVALAGLCRALPDHPDWMKWYSAVSLYSEYLKAISRYTEPYNVMPASIYDDQEYQFAPESRRESFRQQVLNGISLGSGHYLRLFPVWMDYRGHFGVILPKAIALEEAAELCGDLSCSQLARQQCEWVIGRNPFAQSCMWGEGYDYTPLYSPMSGDIPGALPVGIQTRAENDVPYWPAQATWTYKEVWVHPVAQWIWVMKDLYLPSIVEGRSNTEVIFTELKTNQVTTVIPDEPGSFKINLPQGEYRVGCQGIEIIKSFLPSEKYFLDLTQSLADFNLSQRVSGNVVSIRLNATGSGKHRFTVRADNLLVSTPEQELTLNPGQAGNLEWKCKIVIANIPWVAIVIPDTDLTSKKEITDTSWTKNIGR